MKPTVNHFNQISEHPSLHVASMHTSVDEAFLKVVLEYYAFIQI